jgi:hypothetical protein
VGHPLTMSVEVVAIVLVGLVVINLILLAALMGSIRHDRERSARGRPHS